MQLIVQPVEFGGAVCIDIKPNDILSHLKSKIQDKCGVPDYMQSLIFKTKLLSPDHASVSSLGLYSSAIIQLRINNNAIKPLNKSSVISENNSLRISIRGNACVSDIKYQIKKETQAIVTDVFLDDSFYKKEPLLNDEFLKDYITSMFEWRNYWLHYVFFADNKITIRSVEFYKSKIIQQQDKILQDISNKYLPTSNRTKLLIYGYIHEDYILDDYKWNIIPIDVMNLCHKYYHESLNMFLLTSTNKLYDWTCYNVNDSKQLSLDIYDMDNPNILWSNNSLNSADSSVIVDDILLPKQLDKKLNTLIKSNTADNYFKSNNTYSVLFEMKSRGICYGTAFDYFNNIYSKTRKRINAYKFQLPYLSDLSNTKCHSLYTPHFGLMALFENKNLYNLPLNFEDIDDEKYRWKWRVLSTEIQNISNCCKPLIIDDQDLFIMTESGKCSIFDFWGHTWSTLKPSIYPTHRFSGSYYDRNERSIYIGGGCIRNWNRASKTFEYYDVQKDAWSKLPDFNHEHKIYPTIWKTENILFITGNDKKNFDSSEYLDVRIGKRWFSDNNCDRFDFRKHIKKFNQNISRFVPLHTN